LWKQEDESEHDGDDSDHDCQLIETLGESVLDEPDRCSIEQKQKDDANQPGKKGFFGHPRSFPGFARRGLTHEGLLWGRLAGVPGKAGVAGKGWWVMEKCMTWAHTKTER
jgi:hypothetical protein